MKIGIVENDADFAAFLRERVVQRSGQPEVLLWHSAEVFWRDPASLSLDLVLLDIGLPEMDGVELARMLQERQPQIRKVMISNLESEAAIVKAIRAGALGYVMKSELANLDAVLDVVQTGGAVISPTIALRLFESLRLEEEGLSLSLLTERERQILEEIMSGYSPGRIAEVTGVSVNTIRFHIRNIYTKLQVKSNTELMAKLHGRKR